MIEYRSSIALGLGGNLPFQGASPETILRRAIQKLGAGDLLIRAVSRFFSTPCFPAGTGPDYVNAAVLVKTSLGPAELLHRLHDVEHRFGRARARRWGMRTLDLDILTYGQAILPDRAGHREWLTLPPDAQLCRTPDRLILPHPRLQDRAFALLPLADIAPDWHHPVLHKSVRQLCRALPQAEIDAIRPL